MQSSPMPINYDISDSAYIEFVPLWQSKSHCKSTLFKIVKKKKKKK